MFGRLTLFALLLLAWVLPAAAGERVALIIANSSYENFGKLINPENDARAIAKALEKAGFDSIDLRFDLDENEFTAALQAFTSRAIGTDVAMVYYAGHGVEVGGSNYLVPIKAKLLRSTDVQFEAVPLEKVRVAVSGANKLRMVVLDACRNNPFQLAGLDESRSSRRGLRAIETTSSEFVAYSAKEGTTALDGPPNGNSPFAAALVKALEEPGLEIRLLFGKVRDDVLKATRNEQEPFTYASLGGDAIYLNPPVDEPQPTDQGGANIDAAWQAVSQSGNREALLGFRDSFGSHKIYGPLVNAALKKLDDEQAALIKAAETAKKLEEEQRLREEAAAREAEEKARLAAERLKKEQEKLAAEKLRAELEEKRLAEEKAKKAETHVAALAQEPDSKPKLEAPLLLPDPDLVRKIQSELARLGCYQGPKDNVWGRGTAKALADVNSSSTLKLATAEPSPDTLDQLQSVSEPLCEAEEPATAAKDKAKPEKKGAGRKKLVSLPSVEVKKQRTILRKPDVAKRKPLAVDKKPTVAEKPKAPIKTIKKVAQAQPKKKGKKCATWVGIAIIVKPC